MALAITGQRDMPLGTRCCEEVKLSFRLPKEATECIGIHGLECRLQCAMQMVRLVCIPFQVPPHPIQTPSFFSPHKLYPRYWAVTNCRFVLPVWPDFEDVNSLTIYL